MKPKLLIGLFIASMLMNVFVVAGFAYSQFQLQRLGESMAARQDAIAKRLGLNDEQRFTLGDIKRAVKATVNMYKQHDAQTLDRYWKVMAQSPPEPEELELVIRQMAENQIAYHRSLSEHVSKFFSVLDETQREQFIEFARQKNLFRSLVNRKT